MEIYRLAKFFSLELPVQIDIILNLLKETFARLAGMVTPQGHEHHVSSRIRNFTIILRICWTEGFKIYKDLYRCPQDLWPVSGPSVKPLTFIAFMSLILIRLYSSHHKIQLTIITFVFTI